MNNTRPPETSAQHTVRVRLAAGFTLIELLLVTALIVIISTVVLTNNSKFGGVVQLENYAYDIALTIRQAQVYGIAVQRSNANTFSAAYGMHFNINSPTTYLLFADMTGTGVYDSAVNPSEIMSTNTILRNYAISQLCVRDASNVQTCSGGGLLTSLDIVFKRPEPDAYISYIDGSGGIHGTYSKAEITLVSPRGEKMTISVFSNGQITVGRFINS